MDKLGDIALFVKVVNNQSMAAAARETNRSPASVTIKINRLEAHYGVKLLNRTTRQISLTEEGRLFYQHCLRILCEVDTAEELLLTGKNACVGPLNITAPQDLGEQHIAPVVSQFSQQHPQAVINLQLNDHVVNLIDGGFDLAVRFGALQDNRMVARKLLDNHRMLCASPAYIKQHGKPKHPDELNHHRCLSIMQHNEPMTQWTFNDQGSKLITNITPAMTSNHGGQIRKWAVEGQGVTYKSLVDIQSDLDTGRLLPLMTEYTQPISTNNLTESIDLHLVYPSREYLPTRVKKLIEALINHFDKLKQKGN